MIPRILKKKLINSLKPGKVTGLFGARRTGKTVLMNEIKDNLKGVLMVHGENLEISEILSSQRLSLLQQMVKGYKYLFIDEAQKVHNIGTNLKLMVDNIPDLSIFITGSSALELKNKTGEPLTGRSKFFLIFPIAQKELDEDYLSAKNSLENKLIYGMYPEVLLKKRNQEKIDELESIKNGYLLKDILELDNQKNSIFILNLLRLIAFQIGSDISYSELASKLSVNKKTVQRYLDILEKTYILFSLPGFSRNLRKEYSKTPRFFFWDNGIRNAVISNYNSLTLRDDIGRLWENFCISERLKKNHYSGVNASHYFWRTYDQKEIDMIEEYGGKLHGFEFKWKKSKASQPYEFINTYNNSDYKIINNENFLDFVL